MKEARALALAVSLLSLVVASIYFNENMNQAQREVYIVGNGTDLEQLNRAIASARPVTFHRDLEWEEKLVKKLNTGLDRTPASSVSRLQLIDQLRYGELRGKYRLVQEYSNGPSLVKEIEYVESLDAGDQPIILKDRKSFLQNYKDAFVLNFETTELDQRQETKQDGLETYKLFGSNKKQIGHAAFKLDREGRVLSVRLSAAEK